MADLATIIADVRAEEEERAAAANLLAADQSPDEALANQRRQAASGVPAPALEETPQLRAAIDRQREIERLTSSPRLRAYLADPTNAAVAHDDVGPLSSIEALGVSMLEWGTVTPGRILAFGAQGQRMIEMGRLANRDNPVTLRAYDDAGPLNAEERARLDQLAAVPRMQPRSPADMVAEQIPQLLGAFDAGGRRAIRDVNSARRQIYGDEPVPLSTPRDVLDAAVLAPVAGVSMAASATGGAVRGVVGFSYEQEAGAAYQEYRSYVDAEGNRISPEIAGRYARRVGEINAAIEFIGLGGAARAAGVNDLVSRLTSAGVRDAIRRIGYRRAALEFGRRVGGAAVTEGLTELTQESVTIGMGMLAQQDAGGEFERMTPEQIAERVWEAFTVGAVVGGVFGSVPAGVHLGFDVRDVQRMREQAAVFESLGDTAQASKLRTRSPGRFAAAVDALTAGGPLAEFRIDAQRFASFFQDQDQDPMAVADQLRGVGRDALARAIETGGELVIPSGTYASQIVGTPADAGLREHVRVGPGEMTPAEIKARMELGVDLQRASQEATRLYGEAQAAAAENQEVFDRVLEMLESAEAYVGSANRTMATLITANLAAWAKRQGVPLRQFLNSIGLDIRGPFEAQRTGAVTRSVLARLDALDPSIPRNAVPRTRVGVARPKADGGAIKIEEPTEEGVIKAKWGDLAYKPGVDLIATRADDASDKYPIKKVIFDASYGPIEGREGEFAKRTDVPYGWFELTEDTMIATAEGLTQAKAGDVVMIGAAGEMWPMSRASFDKRYDAFDDPPSLDAPLDGGSAPDFHPGVFKIGTREEAQALLALINNGGTFEEIMASPLFARLDDLVAAVEPTMTAADKGNPDYFIGRTYVTPGGPVDIDGAMEYLRGVYESAAGASLKREKRLVLVAGHMGAGKSSTIRAITAEIGAAFIDADKAKALSPLYDDGAGAQIVHAETAQIRTMLLEEMLGDGVNMVLETIGHDPVGLHKTIADARAAGYRVDYVLVDVSADEAARRMARRYLLEEGRAANPASVRAHANKPRPNYEGLLADKLADGYVRIDAEGPIGTAQIAHAQGADDLAGAIGNGLGSARSSGTVIGGGAGSPSASPRGQGELFQEGEAGAVTKAVDVSSAEFKRWFKQSKAVDDNGDPLVVYHGTGNLSGMTEFRPEFTGLGNDQVGSGFYFTNRPETASNYTIRRLDIDTVKLGGEEAPGVVAAYLSLQNPIVVGVQQNLTDVLSITAKQARAIIAKAPDLRDPEMSPIANWHDTSRGVTQAMINDVADQYAGDRSSIYALENDFFTGHATEFRHALSEATGHDGVMQEYASGERHFVAWFSEQIKSAISNTGAFDPSDPNILRQTSGSRTGPRGSISFAHDLGGKIEQAVINLFEARNLSTVFHEVGHLNLELLMTIGLAENAPQGIADDAAAVLQWFGVTPEQWRAMSFEEQRPYHEQFAHGFEAYLLEGKAPSVALRGVFQVIKSWLVAIYKQIDEIARILSDRTGRQLQLSDEVRRVMDRMLATDEAIAEAQQTQGADRVMARDQFPKGKVGDRQYARYLANIERARAEAEADLRATVMEALFADRTRWWRSEERKVREGVTLDVDQEPARIAYDWLVSGVWREEANGPKPEGLDDLRLALGAVLEDYGQEAIDALPPTITRRDVEALVKQAQDARRELKKRAPIRLANAVRAYAQRFGGIRDNNGELANVLRDAKGYGRVVNEAGGAGLDDLVMAMWERGYFGPPPQRVSADAYTQFVGTGGNQTQEQWEALSLAEDMEAAGASDADVWRETGWGRGLDGAWMRWLDDKTLTYRLNLEDAAQSTDRYKLEDLIEWPELWAWRDDMREVEVQFYSGPENEGGAYLHNNGGLTPSVILINRNARVGELVPPDAKLRDQIVKEIETAQARALELFITIAEATDKDVKPLLEEQTALRQKIRSLGEKLASVGVEERMRQSLRHEMQHAVQRRNPGEPGSGEPGMASGADPTGAVVKTSPHYDRLVTLALAGEKRKSKDGSLSLAASERAVQTARFYVYRHEIGEIYAEEVVYRAMIAKHQPGKEWSDRSHPSDIRQPHINVKHAWRYTGDAFKGGGGPRSFSDIAEDSELWVAENTTVQIKPVNGETIYRFKTREHLKINDARVEFSEYLGDRASVVTIFRGATDKGDRGRWSPADGDSVRRGLQLFSRVLMIVRDHMRRNDFASYEFTGASESHDRLYRMLLRQFKFPGYRAFEVFRRELFTPYADGAIFPYEKSHFYLIKEGRENEIIRDPANKNMVFQEVKPIAPAPHARTLYQDGERPSITEFLDRLADDLRGNAVHSYADLEDVDARRQYEELREWFAVRGVDILKDDRETLIAKIKRLAIEEDRDGLHPDMLASIFDGYAANENVKLGSGEALLKALANMRPRHEEIRERTRQRLIEKYGDPFADGTIAEEARMAAHREARARTIELELDAIARATGGVRPVSAAAKEIAERQIEHMTVKQIRGYDWFLGNERREAKHALEALARGDAHAAQQHKYKQLINFHLYRLARKAAEEMDVAQRYLRKFERPGVRENIDQEYLDQIDGLLEQFELKNITGREHQRRLGLAQWAADMEARGLGHLVNVDPRRLQDASRRPFTRLPLDEARGLVDTVKNIEHLGRLRERLLAEKEKREFRATVDGVIEQMRATGPLGKGVRSNYTPTALQRVQERLRRAHAEMTLMEFLFRYLDGKANGPVWNALWAPFARAADKETALMRNATKGMQAIWARYSQGERARMLTKKINVPELPIVGAGERVTVYTKADIFCMALNWGNEGNRAALLQGFGWDEAAVQAVLDRELDARDWETVQMIWDLIGTFRDEAFQLHEDLTGVRPKAVDPMPVQTPHGVLRGGYYPLKYDGERNVRQDRDDKRQEALENWGSNWSKPMTRKGHLEARVGSGGRPVKLNLSVFVEHVNNVAHDIAYRRAVIDAARIIDDEAFATEFIAVAGKPMYDQLRPWLQSIASDKGDPTAMMWKFLHKVRGNVAIAAMGYRLSTGLQQITGLLQAVPELGSIEMAGALAKLTRNPLMIAAKAQVIEGKSEFMRSRRQTLDRDIRETLEGMQTTDKLYPIRHHAFALVGIFDWAVSATVWTAAYDKAMGGKVKGIEAGDEAAAIAYGDSMVRRTQSAGLNQDLPTIMRGNQVNKLLTMFYSYFSVLYNWTAYDQVMGARKGRVPVPILVANLALMYVISPLMAEALAGRLAPREDETEEERNERVLGVLMRYPAATLPIVRDVVNVIGTTFDYQLSPVESGPKMITRAVQDAAAGRTFESENTAKTAVNAAGYAFGLPSGQAWTTIDYVADQIEGEETGFDPIEAFVADRR